MSNPETAMPTRDKQGVDLTCLQQNFIAKPRSRHVSPELPLVIEHSIKRHVAGLHQTQIKPYICGMQHNPEGCNQCPRFH